MSSKKVIITGTSRGIGYELVKCFAEGGHEVLALSRNDQPVNELKLDGVTVLAFDLANSNDHADLADRLSKEWDRVDILINNAGKLINKPFAETTTADYESVFRINLYGLVEVTRTVLPFMEQGGHVVNISSMGGIQGSLKFPGLAAYSSSKGAVITLTELLAEEYKETGPAFNALALGAVQTEMPAQAFPDYKAPTTAGEMAEYIYEFALNGQKHFNGKVLQVSGSTP